MNEEQNLEVLEAEPTPEDIRRETIKELTWHSPASGSKHKTSLSRTRSGIGKVIYQAGQKATHILFCGQLFPWIEKAPYVTSGLSTYGAAEYCESTDEFKCHECGEWFQYIGCHIRIHRPLNSRQYLTKHGFALKHKIITPTRRKECAARPFTGRIKTIVMIDPCAAAKLAAKRQREIFAARINGMSLSPETANLRNKCIAQLEKQIIDLSVSLGHTPTRKELCLFVNDEGAHPLHAGTLRRIFGVAPSKILSRLGLRVRKAGEILTPEQRSERGRRAMESMSPEQRSEHARRAAIACAAKRRQMQEMNVTEANASEQA